MALRKVKKTFQIDSADRDTTKYPTNGDYVVYLPRMYKNVTSLRLKGGDFSRNSNVNNVIPFSPSIISKISLWLDSADTSTIVQSGGLVSSWNDKSGNGYNATQSTSSNQPRWTNTTAGVSFDGITQALSNTSVSISLGEHTVFIVQSQAITQTNARFFCMGPDYTSSDTGSNSIYYGGGGNACWAYGLTGYYAQPFGVTNPWPKAIYSDVYSYNSSGYGGTLYLNGTSTGNAGIVGHNWGTNSVVYTVGSGYSASQLNNFFNGNIYEILVYSVKLSTFNRQIVEGYLAWKWGLQANLQSNHPYKNAAPLVNVTSISMLSHSITNGQNNPSINTLSDTSISPFDPSKIYGCTFWLDSADMSTITLSGSGVSQWADKSGNNYNVVQGTDSARPTLLNKLNGLNTLNFNGSQYLTLSSGFDFANGDVTCFIVANFSTANASLQTAAVGSILSKNYPTNQYWQFGGINNGGPQCQFVMVTPSQTFTSVSAGGVLNNGWDVIAYTLSLSGAQASTLFIHGTSGATATTFTSENTTSNGTIYVGSTASGGTSAWKSDVAEIIVYKSFLTASQRQQVEGYLAWKWGFNYTLPSNHPYNSNPPVGTGPYYFLMELEGLNKSDETIVGGDKSAFVDKYFAKIPMTTNLNSTITYNDKNLQENVAQYTPAIENLDRLHIKTRTHTQQDGSGFIYSVTDYNATFEIEYMENTLEEDVK